MNFKKELYQQCHKIVDDRIALARKLIEEAQTAASQDTKSSMGDKYETSREMMALEMRKAAEQLHESAKLKQVLSELNPDKVISQINIGSLVFTSIGDFYVSISLGQIQIQDKTIFALSAVSPLGKKLLNKQKGDEFDFNSKKIKINSIA